MEQIFEPYLKEKTSHFLSCVDKNYIDDELKKKRLELYLYMLMKDNIWTNKINNNEVSIEDLSLFSQVDFNKTFYHNIQSKKTGKYKKELYGNTLRSTTDMFICRKCKKRECSYYELQLRSADEPMTKFIKCCNCGFEWRQ